MRILQKPYFICLFYLLLLCILAIVCYQQISRVTSMMERIHGHVLPVLQHSLTARNNVVRIQRDMKNLVLKKSQKELTPALATIDEEDNRIYESLAIIRNNVSSQRARELIKQTIVLADNWKPIRNKVIDAIKAGQFNTAADLTLAAGAAHAAKIEQRLTQLVQYLMAHNTRIGINNNRLIENAFLWVVLTAILLILIGIAYLLFIYYMIKLQREQKAQQS